jgi:glycine/D-amino acid oxidase-like deaminating enzyme
MMGTDLIGLDDLGAAPTHAQYRLYDRRVEDCDIVVVGAGAMGSSTAWWLARCGLDVVLVEQFAAGHQRGSSHGSTRVFRLAYPEPIYVDMARRTVPLWREVEDEAGVDLLVRTGGIDYGDPASVQPVVDALISTSVPHEIVRPLEAARRWPGFSPEEAFLIERQGPIVVGSPCSGHGFKFVPLIGRQLAELARGRS